MDVQPEIETTNIEIIAVLIIIVGYTLYFFAKLKHRYNLINTR